jgi:hypothetical protein
MMTPRSVGAGIPKAFAATERRGYSTVISSEVEKSPTVCGRIPVMARDLDGASLARIEQVAAHRERSKTKEI